MLRRSLNLLAKIHYNFLFNPDTMLLFLCNGVNVKQVFSVIDSNCREFGLVKSAFERLIKPIYGAQELALDKIGRGEDRLCEGLFVDDKLTGLLVYKKALTDGKSLEIKTLVLVNPDEDSGKGLGSVLFNRAMEVAKQRQSESIVLTVSSQKPEALAFFVKKGFNITASIKDRYKVGETEHDLRFKLPALQNSVSIIPGTSLIRSSSSSSSNNKRSYEQIKRTSVGNANAVVNSKHFCSSSIVAANKNNFFANSKPRHHECSLKGQYIKNMLNGQKSWEGRCNTEFFRDYRVGDTVTWSGGGVIAETKITERRVYNSFESMLRDIGYKNMVPEAKNFDDAVQIYKNIPNYIDRSRRFGVVAFGVQLCYQNNNTNSSSSSAFAR